MLRTWLPPAPFRRGGRWLRHLATAGTFSPLRGLRLVLRTRLPPALFKRGTPGASHQAAASIFYPASRGKPGASHLARRPSAAKPRLATASGCFAPLRLFTLRVKTPQRGQKTLLRQAFRAASRRLFTLFQSVKSVIFMAALFHAFLRPSAAKGATSRLSPTGKGLVGPSGRPRYGGLFCQKPPSGKDFDLRPKPLRVNLSKLVNWLHSRVFGHFQKMAKNPKGQKPRLASVWQKLRFCQLHLTTFDQKTPEPKMSFGDGLERLWRHLRCRGRRRSGFSGSETESLGETRVFGEIFREILGKFLYAAPRKNFRGRALNFRRAAAPFRAKIFAAPRAIFRARERSRGGQKPRRGDGFRALRSYDRSASQAMVLYIKYITHSYLALSSLSKPLSS